MTPHDNHMIAVNEIHIFRTKIMRSHKCLKQRKHEDKTEDCVRQTGPMEGIVTFIHTGRILKLTQK